MNYYDKYIKYKTKYLSLKGGIIPIKYTTFRFIDYPGNEFDEIQQRLTELQQICEPDEARKEDYVYAPFVSPSRILVGYDISDVIQGFLVITKTDDLINFGKPFYKTQDELHNDFVKRGGILGKNGLFITSVCGNILQYSGLGKGLLTYLIDRVKTDYMFLHVEPSRNNVIELYKKYAFKEIGNYIDNNETFIVMRRQ